IVRHAAAHSRFYREHYRGIDLAGPIDVVRLPHVEKAALLERFDDWVTDPRLRLRNVEAHVSALAGDDLLLDEYRACATGGTTGRRCIFLFSRVEWSTGTAGGVRWTSFTGATPPRPAPPPPPARRAGSQPPRPGPPCTGRAASPSPGTRA